MILSASSPRSNPLGRLSSCKEKISVNWKATEIWPHDTQQEKARKQCWDKLTYNFHLERILLLSNNYLNSFFGFSLWCIICCLWLSFLFFFLLGIIFFLFFFKLSYQFRTVKVRFRLPSVVFTARKKSITKAIVLPYKLSTTPGTKPRLCTVVSEKIRQTQTPTWVHSWLIIQYRNTQPAASMPYATLK